MAEAEQQQQQQQLQQRVNDYLTDYVASLPANNRNTNYMGKTKDRPSYMEVQENGDDILRIVTTLNSCGITTAEHEPVKRLAGYNDFHQENSFGSHLQSLQDAQLIVNVGTSLSLTEAGRARVAEQEATWLQFCFQLKYHRFRGWCEANNVAHLLQFSHQATTNLEVLQRMITYFCHCSKGEKVFRHLFAEPHIEISQQRKQFLIDLYGVPRHEWGRWLCRFLVPVGHGKWPKKLHDELFPEGRQPVIWENQMSLNVARAGAPANHEAPADLNVARAAPAAAPVNGAAAARGNGAPANHEAPADLNVARAAPAAAPVNGAPANHEAPAEPPKRRSSRKRKKPKLYGHS